MNFLQQDTIFFSSIKYFYSCKFVLLQCTIEVNVINIAINIMQNYTWGSCCRNIAGFTFCQPSKTILSLVKNMALVIVYSVCNVVATCCIYNQTITPITNEIITKNIINVFFFKRYTRFQLKHLFKRKSQIFQLRIFFIFFT